MRDSEGQQVFRYASSSSIQYFINECSLLTNCDIFNDSGSEKLRFFWHNLPKKGGFIKNWYFLTIFRKKGSHKKTGFFLLLVKKLSPPPPSPFLTTSVFSDKDFLDWPRPPPLFGENWSKKYQFFFINLVNYAKKSQFF